MNHKISSTGPLKLYNKINLSWDPFFSNYFLASGWGIPWSFVAYFSRYSLMSLYKTLYIEIIMLKLTKK